MALSMRTQKNGSLQILCACSKQTFSFKKKKRNVTPQVPFKHESLLADKKEKKLTKAEKREAKRGLHLL